MKRRLALLALPLAVAFGVAACGGSNSNSNSNSGSGGDKAGGTIAVITVDPSNPYWKAEVDTAVAEAKKLGYDTTVDAHNNDPDKQNQFVDGAISKKVKAIILDPAAPRRASGRCKRPLTPASRCSWSTPRSPSRASRSPRSCPTTLRAPP
ncbi:substrate-binding domain-containing protein [Micromonospora sp. ATA32]|nr:substrate-binding domain-containing protein [Micromonospora sp. ATA32]